MKVLFLTNIPSPYRVKFFYELGKKVDLTVLYEKNKADDRDDKWIQKSETLTYQEVYLEKKREGIDTAYCPEVIKYLSNEQYEIIVVGGYSTPTARKAITYMHRHRIQYWLNCDGAIIKKEPFLKYIIKRRYLRGAKGYLSTGVYTDKWLMHYGISQSIIYRYPFTSLSESDLEGHIIDQTTRNQIKKDVDFSHARVVLSVGQFIYRKGYDVLIKASSLLPPDIDIYIIGGTPTKEYLDLASEYNPDHIHFLPFMNEKELKQRYLAADLFVLPTREDIWGLVINEAMGNGLEVVTTDRCIAGLELIEDGVNGRIVPSDDVDSLANAILQELNLDEDVKRSKRQETLNRIKTYTIESMANEHLKIWSENCE